ncbi:hypothetical protein GCM10010350_77540 [Streptomyces galilaeus]|nr:hypothetical protein GCM10010350_77540 [Streptomyces galilaeus]
MEDWAEIRRLHRAEQMPVRAIARKLGIARNTVRRAIADDAPPKCQRAPKGSIVDAVEPQIRELLEQWPEMPATVIAERIGWDRGLTVLKDRVRDLRPAYRPADPASRTVYEPGEIGQCDLWFPPADIPLGFGQVGRPPVLVMVAGYSRWITARMLPSRSAADLIAGHWRLLTELGAVPRVLVWDNEGAVGSWRSGGPQLTDEFAAFAGLLGIKFLLCKPRDPEAKGLVERANGYLETSFLPGRVFTSPADFNIQLADWLTRANRRIHRTLQARPADRLEADRSRMLALPPIAPPGWWKASLRLPGPLRPPGHLRLLGASAGRRPPHRGRRRPGPGPGDLRRRRGRPPCPQLGSPPDHHRPGPRGRCRGRPQGGRRHETGAGGCDGGRGAVAGHLRPDLRCHRRRAEHQ